MKSKATGIKAAIKGAQLPERTVPICLRGDLSAQIEDLEARHAEALAMAGNSLAGGPEAPADLAEQLAKLREQAAEHIYQFRIRALPRRRWDTLVAAHPPREGKRETLNPETFFDALVRTSVVEPELDADDWDDLLGVDVEHEGDCRLDDPDTTNEACPCRYAVLTHAQFTALADTASDVNSRDTNIPFSPAASMLRRLSGNG